MALPLTGTALALVAEQFRSFRDLAEPVYIFSILAVLLLGFILQPVQTELIIGNWSPVSFTGTPLILAAYPGGVAVLIAVAAIMPLSPFSDRDARESRWTPIIAGWVFAALCMAVLANDMVTLLVGISLVDIAIAVHGLAQQRPTGTILRDSLFRAASIALLAIAITLYDATGNSLYLPLALIPERLMPFFAGALVLRLCLMPIRAVSDQSSSSHWVDKAASVASLLLLWQLPALGAPELHAWFFAITLLTAITTLVLGALSIDRTRLQTSVETGALAIAALTAVTWHSSLMIAATIAWLLGESALNYDASALSQRLRRFVQIPRMAGLLCMIGLPLTIGFTARYGIIATYAHRNVGGVLLISGFGLAHILLTYCTLRLWKWTEVKPTRLGMATPMIRVVILVIPTALIFVFGLSPGITTAPALIDQIGAQGIAGWVVWIISSIMGFALWQTESRWSVRIAASRERLSNIVSLGWWQDTLSGAIDRLSSPLHAVITFLDSDGALLWAIIVILVVVLVSRPGGP